MHFIAKRWIVGPTRQLASAVGLVILGAGAGHAQCVPYSERAPTLELQAFASDPGSFLRELRYDNTKVELRLAGYLVTDPTLLPFVRKLIADAPSGNRRAIGGALRRAELQCTGLQPEASRKISTFVRNLGDKTVLAGYAAVGEEFLPQDTTDTPKGALAGAPTPPPSGAPAKAPVDNPLFTGEWNTDLVDPFAEVPAPLTVIPFTQQP